MFNYDRITATLLADAAVVALLDAYGANKAIFADNVVPKDFTGDESINFYHSPINPTLEYEDETYTLNCRSATYTGAMDLQSAVKNAFNRKATQSDGFYTVFVLSVIGPADQTDNYNGPVEVRLRKR